MQYDPEQPFFNLDDDTIDHLAHEMPQITGELEELHHLVDKLSRKGHRRMEKIRRHMMTCGVCLSKQMRLGLLMPIEDYWESGRIAGAGRLPKLEWMTN